MDDSSDFTFCQVGIQSNDEHLGAPDAVPNITKPLDNSLMDDVNNIRLRDNDVKNSEIAGSPFNNVSETDQLTSKASAKTGDTRNGVKEQKPAIKKPAVRAKVPFEKGYSQMDWLRLTRTDPDLAGLKGRSNRRLISMTEVKQHKTEGPIWTVLKGRVYNISPYMKFHPGGVDMLMKAAGKDCTALFNKYHAWVNAEFLLEKCLVGVLDDSS